MKVPRPTLFVFLAVALLLTLLHSHRFVLTNDEGILLEPAQRMAAGARPYVDFFGYMSPGSYWIQAAVFKLFGVTLWAARVPVILDLSLQCALLYWLISRLGTRPAAVAALLVFLGFQIADPCVLTAQHRWDSTTLALAGVCLLIGYPARFGLACSGILLAAAAWCTPSVALVGVAATVWLAIAPGRRRQLAPFIAGALALTAVAAAWLHGQGTLPAFFDQMLWLRRNYSAVNVLSYGSVIGGYGRLFEGAAGLETLVRVVLVGCLALPAILPPLAVLIGGFVYSTKRIPNNSRPAVLLLLLVTGALVASVLPRADLMHLQFVVVLPYALVATALARLLSRRTAAILALTIIPLASLFALSGTIALRGTRPLASPVGTIRVAHDIAPGMDKLLSLVRPGHTLFVYPYMPVYYFVTQALNPTRFSYLAPGMMTNREELQALGQLAERPPEWVLYMRLTREEFLRVFPNGGALSEHFPILEEWLNRNYQPVTPEVNIAGYRLWRYDSEPGSPEGRPAGESADKVLAVAVVRAPHGI